MWRSETKEIFPVVGGEFGIDHFGQNPVLLFGVLCFLFVFVTNCIKMSLQIKN